MSKLTIKKIGKPKIKLPKIAEKWAIHVVIIQFLFLLLGLWVAAFNFSGGQQWIILTVGSLLIGWLHFWAILDEKSEKKVNLQATIILNFTAFLTIFIIVFFASGMLKKAILLAMNTFNFSFLFFFQRALNAQRNIPVATYEGLVIDNLKSALGTIVIGQSKTTGMVWEFELIGNNATIRKEHFRVFLPENIANENFEKVFKAILLEYNNKKNPGCPIPLFYKNELGGNQAYQWFFYQKKWFGKSRIDPQKSIAKNGIRFKEWKGKNKHGHPILIPKVARIRVVNLY